MPPRKKWINFGNWKSFEASFMNLMRNLCLFTFSSCGKKPLSFLSVHVDTNYQEFIKEFLLVFLCDYWEIVIVVDFAILGPCFLINLENQVFWFLCAKSIAEFYKEKNWCGPSLRPLPAWYSTVVCLPFLSFSLTKLLHPWVTCQPCYACSSPFRSTGTRKLISAQTHYAIKLSPFTDRTIKKTLLQKLILSNGTRWVCGLQTVLWVGGRELITKTRRPCDPFDSRRTKLLDCSSFRNIFSDRNLCTLDSFRNCS